MMQTVRSFFVSLYFPLLVNVCVTYASELQSIVYTITQFLKGSFMCLGLVWFFFFGREGKEGNQILATKHVYLTGL